MGRQPAFLLEPAKVKTLLDAIRTGAPYEHCARKAGFCPRKVQQWLARGRKASKGPYHDFLSQVLLARSEMVVAGLATIQKAGTRNWKAWAWILSCRYPDHFSSDKKELRELKDQVRELQQLLKRVIDGNGGGAEAGGDSPASASGGDPPGRSTAGPSGA